MLVNVTGFFFLETSGCSTVEAAPLASLLIVEIVPSKDVPMCVKPILGIAGHGRDENSG